MTHRPDRQASPQAPARDQPRRRPSTDTSPDDQPFSRYTMLTAEEPHPNWIHSADGLAVKAGDAEESIISGVDPVLTAEAVKRLNWQGMRAFTETLGAAATDVPLTYVVATEDPALPPEVPEQWAGARPIVCVFRAGTHSPHLSHTDEVAAFLAEAVARAEK
ncbi:alpha/beta fold hydrolase [Streptomyces sp. NPDC005402]|uniref:alpha/beta fold hydrolase n=1 Tax=Streptomyces sp. NPDC005402 TaxID=3155338 RepID=UPI0033B453E0